MFKNQIAGLMQQMQKAQEDIKQAQERLASQEITGSSGGGLVQVVMTGRHQVRRVQIDRALLADDPEMAEDLIAAAVNDAVNKVTGLVEATMAEATKGMPLPPGMKIPGLL
ncbi:MAG: YbaB/EbfC family nucleoid-associated protein [Xanthomonadales bacterium]|nr:YbaB/EbfC family nucleoid-associated protein [Xanthomonadales bacterium]